jgi:hypothetical protein
LLALLAARSLLRDGRVLVVLDRERTFYPPAAAAWGMPLEETIVVYPANATEELWALEQCLQSAGVAVSWCRLERATSRQLRRLQLAAERGRGLGFLLRPLSARGQPAWNDVRLAVTPSVDRPDSNDKSESHPPSQTALRDHVSEGMPTQSGLRRALFGAEPQGRRQSSRGHGIHQFRSVGPPMPNRFHRRWNVELVRSRRGTIKQTVILEFNDATGDVSQVSELAPAKSVSRAARA